MESFLFKVGCRRICSLSIFDIFDWFDLGKSHCTSGRLGQHGNTITGCVAVDRIWTQPIDDIYVACRSSAHSIGCVHVSCMLVYVVSFRLHICFIVVYMHTYVF